MGTARFNHCDACGKKHERVVYLHSKCHTTKPTWAKIDGGTLIIECSECRDEIARFPLNDSEKLRNALSVLVKDNKIRLFLLQNDPKALEQAEEALN